MSLSIEEDEVLIELAQKILKGRQRRQAEKEKKRKELEEPYSFQTEPVLNCNFCGKKPEEVKRLITGPDVRICDGCVALCNDIIVREMNTPKEEKVCEQCGKNDTSIRTLCGRCRM